MMKIGDRLRGGDGWQRLKMLEAKVVVEGTK